MAKYLLARGQTRLPIDGVREIKRENDKPLRQTETVIFSPNKIVESDLDFGSWLAEGVIVCVDPPPRPGSVVTPPQAPVRPIVLPIPAQVEVMREPPRRETPPQKVESRISTRPTPMPNADLPSAPVPQDLMDAGVVVAPRQEALPVEEAPVLTEVEVEAEAPKDKADPTTQVRGGARGKRRR
jgi:hypothetical protein